MNNASQEERSQSKPKTKAIVIGFIAFLITAIVVMQYTPDGNLVVTLLPALAVGLAVYGLASWRLCRGKSS